MSPAIRPATPDDLPEMLALWVEAWAAAMPDIDFQARLPWLRERLKAAGGSGTDVLVAVDEGVVRGFVVVDAAIQDMDQLVIARGAQGQGFGRCLVQAAKARALEGLGLKVNQRNLRAIRLYESEGFVTIGEGVSSASGLPLFHMHWPGRPHRQMVKCAGARGRSPPR